jgi:hypothetical protein
MKISQEIRDVAEAEKRDEREIRRIYRRRKKRFIARKREY